MASTPEQSRVQEERISVQNRLIKALADHGAGNPTCPICHTTTFGIGYFINLPATRNPLRVVLGAESYPCVALVCQTCGNLQLINLLLLGFTRADLASLTYPEEPAENA